MIKKIYGFELGDKYNSYRFRNFDMNFIYHALSEVYIESEPGLNNGFVESGPVSLYRIPGLYTVVRDEFIISEEKEIINNTQKQRKKRTVPNRPFFVCYFRANR